MLQVAAKRVRIVVAILSFQAFWLFGTNAFAQQAQDVPVTGAKTNPVNVHGTVNMSAIPYQVERAIANSSPVHLNAVCVIQKYHRDNGWLLRTFLPS